MLVDNVDAALGLLYLHAEHVDNVAFVVVGFCSIDGVDSGSYDNGRAEASVVVGSSDSQYILGVIDCYVLAAILGDTDIFAILLQ